jgi:iron complex transport system permease protein
MFLKPRFLKIFAVLFILLICFAIWDLFYGSVQIPLKNVLQILFSDSNENPQWKTIIQDFRLPKTLTAMLAGAALSVSGLQIQTTFRNPLAGPFVLGINAGASLGVAVFVLGFSFLIPIVHFSIFRHWSLVIAAWAGAGMVLSIIIFISIRVRDLLTILIVGIMIGSGISAVVTILQFFSDAVLLKSFVIWTMGSIGGVTRDQLWVLLPSFILGFIVSLISARSLNAMLLSENYAITMGVNVRRTRMLVFISTSILTGSITAFCGPIGFIDIAIPHFVRLIFKTSNHFVLMIGCALLGATIMLLCDILTILPLKNNILPINSITAMIGVPVIIWILLKNQRISL